jgi:hypothetical protein
LCKERLGRRGLEPVLPNQQAVATHLPLVSLCRLLSELILTIRAVFVGKGFLLLTGGKDYRIAHNHEIIDWQKLTYSLHS